MYAFVRRCAERWGSDSVTSWIATLIGCCMAIRDGVGQRTVMWLALFIIFLLIFEARVRCVSPCASHLVLLGVPGRMRMWDAVAVRVSRCNR